MTTANDNVGAPLALLVQGHVVACFLDLSSAVQAMRGAYPGFDPWSFVDASSATELELEARDLLGDEVATHSVRFVA